jgi:uncharacterized protein YfaS (alpha-2-macroglobulin family)
VRFEAPLAQASLTTTVKLAPRQRATVAAPIKPQRPGPVPYTLDVTGGDQEDHAQGVLPVLPSGLTRAATQHALASADKPAQLTFTVPAESASAQLSVALPSTSFAALPLQEIGATLADDPLSMAADLTSAALMLQYAQRHHIDSTRLQDLRQRVLGALLLVQGADGAFAYWRNGRAGAFMTAWALEGMLGVQVLDIAVPQERVVRAAEWLASRVEADGAFNVRDIAFWEGDDAKVRDGVAAEVLHVLTLVPQAWRTPPMQSAIDRLATRFAAYLTAPNPEPLATGRAILALHRLGKLDQAASKQAIGALLKRRRDAHWEPSWFHGWGGMVELNTALMLAMQATDTKLS